MQCSLVWPATCSERSGVFIDAPLLKKNVWNRFVICISLNITLVTTMALPFSPSCLQAPKLTQFGSCFCVTYSKQRWCRDMLRAARWAPPPCPNSAAQRLSRRWLSRCLTMLTTSLDLTCSASWASLSWTIQVLTSEQIGDPRQISPAYSLMDWCVKKVQITAELHICRFLFAHTAATSLLWWPPMGFFSHSRVSFGLSFDSNCFQLDYHLHWHPLGGVLPGQHHGEHNNFPPAQQPLFQFTDLACQSSSLQCQSANL